MHFEVSEDQWDVLCRAHVRKGDFEKSAYLPCLTMLNTIEQLMPGLRICLTLHRNNETRENHDRKGLLALVSSDFPFFTHFPL